jgi:hypothetical protein
VHLDSANEQTYSNEFAKLLLLIGSEVDVVAKMICKNTAPSKSVKNIEDYRDVIVSNFPGMHAVEIEISTYAMKIQPWLSWDPVTSASPRWWKAYNNVKHERDINFTDANQKHTLQALCGLLSLLLYLCKDEAHLQPYPKLLEYGFPSYLVTSSTKILPGVI